MPIENGALAKEFLETIGAIRGDIREIRSNLEHVSNTQEKQWKRHDQEVEQRQEVDAKLLARLDYMEGGKSALKWIAPFIWAVTFTAMGWMAREVWHLKEGIIVLQNTGISPEEILKVQEAANAALESQAVVRQIQAAQERMQSDIEELKNKPVPKVPAPVNKTLIIPAPKDYTFERLIRESDIQVDKPKAGPRK